MIKIFLLILLSLSFSVQAQTDFNKILFSIGTSSWSLRDREAYQAVLTEVFQKKALSEYSKNPENDFLLSRLSYKEAGVFELSPSEKIKVSEAARKKLAAFSPEEVLRETDYISKAAILVEIKESQQKDVKRFNTWFELLKRKYQVRLK